MTHDSWLQQLLMIRRTLVLLRESFPNFKRFTDIPNELRTMERKVGSIRTEFQQLVKHARAISRSKNSSD